MYIYYDFQVKMPTNEMLKKLSDVDFLIFYQNSIVPKIENCPKLASVSIKTNSAKIKDQKPARRLNFTQIHFTTNDEFFNPKTVASFNLFKCSDFGERDIADIETYKKNVDILTIEWQQFLTEKLGEEYKNLLDDHKLKSNENQVDPLISWH